MSAEDLSRLLGGLPAGQFATWRYTQVEPVNGYDGRASRGPAVRTAWSRGKIANKNARLEAKRRGEEISVGEFVSRLQEVVFHSEGVNGVLEGFHELAADLGFSQLAYLLERVERSKHLA